MRRVIAAVEAAVNDASHQTTATKEPCLSHRTVGRCEQAEQCRKSHDPVTIDSGYQRLCKLVSLSALLVPQLTGADDFVHRLGSSHVLVISAATSLSAGDQAAAEDCRAEGSTPAQLL